MTKSLRAEIEDTKFDCPSCPLPHNLSTKEVDKILAAVEGMVERVRPDDNYHLLIAAALNEYLENIKKEL